MILAKVNHSETGSSTEVLVLGEISASQIPFNLVSKSGFQIVFSFASI